MTFHTTRTGLQIGINHEPTVPTMDADEMRLQCALLQTRQGETVRRKIKPYPNTVKDHEADYIPRQHLWHRDLKHLAKWMLIVCAALFMAATIIGFKGAA